MRTYYINEMKTVVFTGGIKNQQIKENTLVWYQGMDEWKHAVDLEDFKPLQTF
jgi:hypothetical protein